METLNAIILFICKASEVLNLKNVLIFERLMKVGTLEIKMSRQCS